MALKRWSFVATAPIRALALSAMFLCSAFSTMSASAQTQQPEALTPPTELPPGPPPLETYDAATPLVSIGERIVTLGDLIRSRQAFGVELQGLPDDIVFAALLDEVIRREAFAEAARREGLESDPDVARAIALARSEILAEAYVERVIVAGTPQALLADQYQAETATLAGQSESLVRHILTTTREEALAAKAAVDAGADFAAVAQERSAGLSGPDGGDLGFLREGDMPPAFDAIVATLSPGQVSAPVETVLGWHVIKLEERREIQWPSFEERAPDLARAVAEDVAVDLVDALNALGGAPVPPAAADVDPVADFTRALLERLAASVRIVRPERLPPPSAIQEDALVGAP